MQTAEDAIRAGPQLAPGGRPRPATGERWLGSTPHRCEQVASKRRPLICGRAVMWLDSLEVPTNALNGVELHFERSGAGARLLFCNGSDSTLEGARPLIAQLAAHFDVLAPGYRGMGQSGPLRRSPTSPHDVNCRRIGNVTPRAQRGHDPPPLSLSQAIGGAPPIRPDAAPFACLRQRRVAAIRGMRMSC